MKQKKRKEMSNSSFFTVKKFYKLAVLLVVMSAIIIILVCSVYNFNLKPVSNNEEKISLIIDENATYLSIAPQLKDNKLIRSETAYKIYIKLFKPANLKAGKYELSKNMGVKEIVKYLEETVATNPNVVNITIPEGKHLEDVASIVADTTNQDKDELLALWDSDEFVDKVISTYWFVTDDVKNSSLKYKLEGYFFPSTYEIDVENFDGEIVAYQFLDQMNDVLNKYKEDILKSEFSVHELLTISSIVEHEAILDEDRSIIAGVFYNRLRDGMKLQSCATIGYAIDEWKLTYTDKDLNTQSPYNTYLNYGLPVGPGCLPSEDSIKAVIYPDDNDYLYFLANVYNETDNKTYYSNTYSEHQQKCLKYLNRSC